MTTKRAEDRRTRVLGGARQTPSSAQEIDLRLAGLDERIHQFKLRMAGLSEDVVDVTLEVEDA